MVKHRLPRLVTWQGALVVILLCCVNYMYFSLSYLARVPCPTEPFKLGHQVQLRGETLESMRYENARNSNDDFSVTQHGNNADCSIRVFVDNDDDERYSIFSPWVQKLKLLLGIPANLIVIPDLSVVEYDKVLERWNSTSEKTTDECYLDILLVSRAKPIRAEDSERVTNMVEHGLSVKENVAKLGSLPVRNLTFAHEWVDGIHWHKKVSIITFTTNRPLLVGVTAEAFSELPPKRISYKVDIMISRVRLPAGRCLTGHIVQGVSLGYRRPQGNMASFDVEMRPQWDLNTLVQDPADSTLEPFFADILKQKKGFAAIMNQRIMKRSIYLMDGVVRFVICDILNDYKPCHSISRTKNYLQNREVSLAHLPCKYPQHYGMKELNWDLAGHRCYTPFKFALGMENTAKDGYISEKLFSAKLAHSVPVYFGAPDVARYINKNAIVICSLSPKSIKKLRALRDTTSRYAHLLPPESKSDNKVKASDEQLVKYIRGKVEDELTPCIEEIKRLDSDDEAYLEKLRQPLLLNNTFKGTYLDGTVIANGIIRLLQLGNADKRIFENVAFGG